MFELIIKETQSCDKTDITPWNKQAAEVSRSFHEQLSGYEPTPLVSLEQQASRLGIAKLLVKDESYRFGLDSFKPLGASFAMGNIVKGWQDGESHVFVTATDGNHGRGVAWMAGMLGKKAVVYLPEGASRRRLENILAEGAEGYITELCYDDAVRLAAAKEKEEGWILLQDTSWDGYKTIPEQIMKGYLTMGLEAYEKMQEKNTVPTHIFLQAGVGSMAAAMTAFFMDVYRDNPPCIIVVEPDRADCIFRSAKRDDGEREIFKGKMDTMMAGLACGEPSVTGWSVLRDYADAFVSCSDEYAAKGMKVLGAPLPGDRRVISGESGAVGVGVLDALMTDTELKEFKERLKLNQDSVVLCFSTEGATDPDNYWDVVWN